MTMKGRLTEKAWRRFKSLILEETVYESSELNSEIHHMIFPQDLISDNMSVEEDQSRRVEQGVRAQMNEQCDNMRTRS